MVCSKCGNANNEGQQHCNYCGAPLKKGSSISRVIIIVILVINPAIHPMA